MPIVIESEVHLRRRFSNFLPRMSSDPPWVHEEAIREELFSVERLEQHAESLAAAQSVSSKPKRGRPIAQRVRDDDDALLEAYRIIAAAIKDKRSITRQPNG